MRVTLNMMAEPGMFGMKRYTLELAEALRPLGVEPTLRHSRRIEARIGPLRVGGLITSRLRNWVPVRRRDLLHATDHKSNPHWPPADVVTVHDLIPSERPDLVEDARLAVRDHAEAQRAARTARRILVPTKAVKASLVQRHDVDPRRVHVVPNGVRHDVFHPEPAAKGPPFRSGSLNVLVAMGLERRKRVDLVAEAAAALPFVNLVHVGRTDLTAKDVELQARMVRPIAELQQQGRYTHIEHVTDAELRRLYAAADVVVHLSEAEGFGLPPLEAMACGARVIASDIAPLREVLGRHARFVPLDAKALWHELDALWDGAAVRDDRPANRQERLEHARTFTWERTAQLTLAAYKEALRDRVG